MLFNKSAREVQKVRYSNDGRLICMRLLHPFKVGGKMQQT